MKHGLLERRADPEDGRASLLVPTSQGRRGACASTTKSASSISTGCCADWSERDITDSPSCCKRFTDDFDSANHDLARTSGSLAQRPRRTEGNS